MGDDGKKKYGLRFRDRKVSAGDTDTYLEMKPVPEGWRFCIQQVAAKDETTAFTRLLIGTKSGATYRDVEDTPSPEAGQNYTWKGELTLHAGEIFSVWFVGTTSGDKLEAVAFGYRQRVC